MNNYEKIQEAKAFLKQNGYYTDNLWRAAIMRTKPKKQAEADKLTKASLFFYP